MTMARCAMQRIRFSDITSEHHYTSFFSAIYDVKKSEIEQCHKRNLEDQMTLISQRTNADHICVDGTTEKQDYVQSTPCTSDDAFFRLNIGGKSYRIRIEMVLQRKDNSLMSTLIHSDHSQRMAIVDAYLPETDEYYIERNVKLADHIIDYYITGLLHKPTDVCVERFQEELQFWNLHNNQLAPCCATLSEPPKEEKQQKSEYDYLTVVCCGKMRRALWKLVEDPQSSIAAKIFAFLSIMFVFVSVIGLVLGSMPEFQEDPSNAAAYHLLHYGSRHNEHSSKFDTIADIMQQFPNFVYRATDNPNSFLMSIEYACMAWFTFEYMLRMLIAPRKFTFFAQSLNIIDLFTILPFYLEFGLPFFGVHAEKLRELTAAMLVIRILRVLRMARVFKLARYSTGLQTFGSTLQSSVTELTMLGMFLITGIVFFSTIIYFLEKDEVGTEFYSIPAACWWCVVTMTTIGYGDSIPQTSVGKMIATLASVCGIIVLAFPISMIVEKFASAQQRAIEREASKQAQMSAVANRYLIARFPTRRKACREPMLAPLQRLWGRNRKSLATIT
ncbi:Potassium voltage-gated channel subfamily B member 1 [Toxocara canis]|uniref:Potassium voltage-gated channel subfamily B member 1 n=1 Tax=Toxocara canis TaxID=6265 RepID=A0A0B2V8Q5_TOXCA|nr:Potassium voltage-gated channel subfamily B member 1 [Toxocara canis]